MQQADQRSWWRRLGRLLRLRLVIPLLRSNEPPIHTARGVGIGLFVAFTPTVGVQMPICFLIWCLLRYLAPAWRFNLIVAMAWTWITNVFTLAPFYFLFVVTGQLMLGGETIGYAEFDAQLGALLAKDASWLEALWVYIVALFESFGYPMFLGSLPWAIIVGYAGYRWSGQFVSAYRDKRDALKAARRRRKQRPTLPPKKLPNARVIAD